MTMLKYLSIIWEPTDIDITAANTTRSRLLDFSLTFSLTWSFYYSFSKMSTM